MTSAKSQFEIHIDQKDQTVGGSSLPIRWCLDPAMFKQYTPDQIKQLKMLIVIIPKGARASGRRERRKVVPVMDLMTWIDFRAPGENLIFGAVLDPAKDPRAKSISNVFLTKRDGDFATDVFYHAPDRCTTCRLDGFVVCDQVTRVTVNVPKELFAPPPPQWEQNFVNSIFPEPPIDQCDFRRRRMISYWAVPMIVLALFLTRMVLITFGLLCGFKVQPKALVCPFAMDLTDCLVPDTQSIFRTRWVGPVKIPLFQFTPLVVLASVGVFYSVGYTVAEAIGYALIGIPALTLAVYIGFGLVVGVCWLLVSVSTFFRTLNGDLAKYTAEREAAKAKKKRVLTEKEKARIEEMKTALTCSGDNMPKGAIGLKSIPREYRTVNLRFHDLKARVCKPFAR